MVDFTQKEKRQRQTARFERARESYERDQQAQKMFEAAERQAFISGAEKSGGFLGFGGTYSGKSKEDFSGSKSASTKGVSSGQALAGAQVATQLLGVGQGDSSEGGAVSGGLSGASTGLALSGGNHYGAAIGGGLGVIAGITGAAARRKAKQAQAVADMHSKMIDVEANKQQRIQGALQDMRQAFSNALRTPVGVSLGGR